MSDEKQVSDDTSPAQAQREQKGNWFVWLLRNIKKHKDSISVILNALVIIVMVVGIGTAWKANNTANAALKAAQDTNRITEKNNHVTRIPWLRVEKIKLGYEYIDKEKLLKLKLNYHLINKSAYPAIDIDVIFYLSSKEAKYSNIQQNGELSSLMPDEERDASLIFDAITLAGNECQKIKDNSYKYTIKVLYHDIHDNEYTLKQEVHYDGWENKYARYKVTGPNLVVNKQ